MTQIKLFRTISPNVIKECRCFFGIKWYKAVIAKRKVKFLLKCRNSENGLCKLFSDTAYIECEMLVKW